VRSSAFVAAEELIRALRQHSRPVPCAQDRVLFRQGEEPTGVYVISDGLTTLTMQSNSGEEVLRIQSGAGSVLGLPGLIGNKPYSLTAVARGGAEVSFVAAGDFSRLMAEEPTLSLKVLEILAAEVHTARRAIFDS
jgi:CRP-like cAMP-binding protein